MCITASSKHKLAEIECHAHLATLLNIHLTVMALNRTSRPRQSRVNQSPGVSHIEEFMFVQSFHLCHSCVDLHISRKHSEIFLGRLNCSQSISPINPCQNPSWILGPLIATYETVLPSKMCLIRSWLGTCLGHTSGTMGCSLVLQEDSLKKSVTTRGHSCPHTFGQLKAMLTSSRNLLLNSHKYQSNK